MTLASRAAAGDARPAPGDGAQAANGPGPHRTGPILPLVLERVVVRAGGRVLLDSVDLVLGPGPLTVILGPNGAGKSLLLRVCHGLLAPSEGRVSWQRPPREAARRQAMVFQRPVMLRRSALANLTYGLARAGVKRGERRRRAAEALARTRLSSLARTPARALSGGEQQRLALARAWALEPEVLFLDEPTAHADPAATLAIEETVRAIHAAGTKIIMTTHDLAQARRLADEIVFLHAGRVRERAPAGRFFGAPRSPEARAFVAGRVYEG